MTSYHDNILPAAPGLGPFFISPYALPLARLLIGLEAHTVHARALADGTMDDLYPNASKEAPTMNDRTFIINRALPLYREVRDQLPKGSKVAEDFHRLMEVVEEDSGGVLAGRVGMMWDPEKGPPPPADPSATTQEATPAACAVPPAPATSPSSEPPAAGPALDTRRRPMTPLVRALAAAVIAAGCVLALALTLFLLVLGLVFLPVLLVVTVAGLVPVLAWRFWRQVARGGVVREARTVIGRTMEPPHRGGVQGDHGHD